MIDTLLAVARADGAALLEPAALDLAFAALFAGVMTLFETFVFFPRFKAAVAAGDPQARPNAYRRAISGQWAFAAIAIVLWSRAARPWARLGLTPPPGYGRLVIALLIVGALCALIGQQVRAIRRMTPDKRLAFQPKLSDVAFILPHTRREFRWFMALSITAGLCEELLYRGFLTWALQTFLGLPGAVVVSVVLFGAGHSYQGRQGALKAGGLGLVMSLIVLATGWLIPAMVVHALIDIAGGILGYTVFGDSSTAQRSI